MTIDKAGIGDRDAIAELMGASFPGPQEAQLVDRLVADGDLVQELVYRQAGHVASYAMFSKMSAPFPALGLGPVATAGGFRRQGLAAALIQAGLEWARDAGWEAVFVLGDPAYYTRFGFSAPLAAGFASPYAGPYLMACALQPSGLAVTSGRIDYPPAFSMFE